MFEYIFTVALCAASVSYTITWAGIFQFLRNFVEKYGNSWLSELIHCPYCFGHYVVLTIMLFTKNVEDRVVQITDWTWFNVLFTWFAIVCIMSILHAVMLVAYRPVAEEESHRKLERMRKENK